MNEKLGTTKLPLEALKAIHEWCWLSSMLSSCIFYIQTVYFITLLLYFDDFYGFF